MVLSRRKEVSSEEGRLAIWRPFGPTIAVRRSKAARTGTRQIAIRVFIQQPRAKLEKRRAEAITHPPTIRWTAAWEP